MDLAKTPRSKMLSVASFWNALIVFAGENRVLLLICFFAFVLRLPQLGFGLPQQFHPDEWIYFTTAFKFFKCNFISNGILIPFVYPYLIFAGYLVSIPVWFIRGDVTSLRQLYSSFYAQGDPYLDYANPHFLFAARLTTVVITVLLGLAIGLFLSRRVSRTTALTATALFFLLPLEFLYSRFGVPDLPLTAAMFASTALLFRFVEFPTLSSWALSTVAVVISIFVKQPGAALVVPLACSLWLVRSRLSPKSLLAYVAITLAAAAAGVVLLCPNMILSPAGLANVRGLAGALFHTAAASTDSIHHELASSPFEYVTAVWGDYGPAILAVCCVGLVVAFRRKRDELWLWLLLLVPFFAVFQIAALKMDRYIIPCTTLFFVWTFPLGLERILQYRLSSSLVIRIALMILLFVFPAYKVASYFDLLAAGDTRLAAAAWLKQYDYSKHGIAREIHDTPLLPAGYCKPVVEEWIVGNYSIDDLRKRGVDMVMISSGHRFLFTPGSRVFRNYESFLDSLQPIAHFESNRKLVTYNPEIDILLLPPAATESK